MKFLIILLTTITIIVRGQEQVSNKIRVRITGIKNNEGLIGIGIFNSSHGFPDDIAKANKIGFTAIQNNTAELVFDHLHEGDYAIVAFHDENKNKKIERNWIGIPNEGIGVSNDAKGNFGPPKFKDAKFTLNKREQMIVIHLSYLK